MKVGDGLLDREDSAPSSLISVKERPAHKIFRKKSVLILKTSVFVCIGLAAAVVGYMAYKVLRDYEYNEFITGYNSLTARLIPAASTGQ